MHRGRLGLVCVDEVLDVDLVGEAGVDALGVVADEGEELLHQVVAEALRAGLGELGPDLLDRAGLEVGEAGGPLREPGDVPRAAVRVARRATIAETPGLAGRPLPDRGLDCCCHGGPLLDRYAPIGRLVRRAVLRGPSSGVSGAAWMTAALGGAARPCPRPPVYRKLLLPRNVNTET